MAGKPNYNDKIIAGKGGATLYGDKEGTPWLWDEKPVKLDEGDFLYSTGWCPEGKNGMMYEVYIYRRRGNWHFYKSRDDAKVGFFDGGAFMWSNINYEIRYISPNEASVSFAAANEGSKPDPSSPISVEKSEKEKVEAELETQIYSKDSSQNRHTSLTQSTVTGKWMLGFANGYTVEYEAFLALTPGTRRGLTSSKSGSGLTDGTGNGTGKVTSISAKETFPAWAYAVVGVLFVSLLVLVMQPFKTKKK